MDNRVDAPAFSEVDAAFMWRALELAARGEGAVSPNPPVGCVLGRGGVVVGEGWHRVCGGPHAEVEALRRAGDRARDATAYVTLMPCDHHGRTPPCTEALLAAGVTRVVAARDDPDPVSGSGATRLRGAGVRVETGLLADEASYVMRGFLKFCRLGLPFVAWKYAMTLDGRVATRTGDARWVSGRASREDVQRLRARHDAVLVGAGTVLADDPRLDVRDPAAASSRRVVLDTSARTPPDGRLLREGRGEVIVVTGETSAPAGRVAALEEAGALVLRVAETDGRTDPRAALAALGGLGIRTVLSEAGSTLSGCLAQAGLLDEAIAYVAPKLVGGNGGGFPPLRNDGVARMADAVPVTFSDIERFGDDIRIRGRIGNWPWIFERS